MSGFGIFPAVCVDLDSLQIALDGVLVGEQRPANFLGTVAQYSIQDFPWQTIRLHAVHMAQPAEASLKEHGRYAHETSSPEDVRVRNLVLPSDVQQAAKQMEVKAVEASLLPGVSRPRLTAIKES